MIRNFNSTWPWLIATFFAGWILVASAPAQPASPSPGVTMVARSAIDGVYVGTYGTNPDDRVAARLYVKFIDNGSVNGTVDGLFTFDVPLSAGAAPITYTYKLTGVSGGSIHFYSAKPVGSPAPPAYAMKEMLLRYVQNPMVVGPNRQYEFTVNPDQVAGSVIGSNGRATNQFVANRDKAALGNLDRLMAAAQASAVNGPAVASAPGSAQPPKSSPSSGASNQIDDVMASVRGSWTPITAAPTAPSLEGVFRGTLNRENEAPTKFMLTITRSGDNGDAAGAIGLTGVATIYLPTSSGTKAYTYSLAGIVDARGHFVLHANEWATIPPPGFENFKAMGFDGTFRSNVTQRTARIIASAAPDRRLFVPNFEAAWDPTASADIKGTLVAQKAVGDADQVAALKAQAEILRNAQPRQRASRNLVRKSQAYWNDFQSDFIREIFDGGFASDVDDDEDFRLLFVDYVDLFAKNCPASLPADHTLVTITTVTTSRYAGGPVQTTRSSYTVDVDSRFAAKYAEFCGVDPTPGSDQAKEQTAKIVAIAGRIFHAGGPSHGTSPADANALLHLEAAHGLAGAVGMEKFFALEVKAGGPSAALRQMGENLLRGALGQPSLQEAGARIDGAEAETDRDLPAGRFTHLVDAAHAFYREPAHASLGSRFETAFDETLAAKYRGVMTPEEEYYYANDYGPRFRDQIMQPRDRCKDPAWPRLHPAVQECVEEIDSK